VTDPLAEKSPNDAGKTADAERESPPQNLELSEANYELMLESVASAVLCLAPDRKILKWSRGAERIFGWSSKEMIGRKYEVYLPETEFDPVRAEFDRILNGGVSRGFENPVLTRDGRQRIVRWNAAPLRDRDGKLIGIFGIGEDVTELRRAQALQSGENRVLELLAKGGRLDDVLATLARTAEEVCPGMRCVVMGASASGRRLHCLAAPNFPDSFRKALDGIPVKPDGAGCSAAAYRRERVLSADITTDPAWTTHRQAALAHGLRTSWSEPILSTTGELLGTFDAYAEGPARPEGFDLEVTARLARLAGIAIEHHQAEEERRRRSENRLELAVAALEALREQLGKRFSFDNIVAVSPPMLRVIRMAAQVAPTETTVLITGETGTGKEIIARAIHGNSPRREGPFVVVNCGAIPETLMESELFGHERGAFTGAEQRKPGQVERAQGGVLFLDEVGELTLPAQVKLLRLLQEKTFERLGGRETLEADVRVIAATNRNLEEEMKRGRFREDLYYRLNVFHIHIPPLRDRLEAVPALADKILKDIAVQLGRPVIRLSRAAMEALTSYEWKGNVRELQNALERAAILCEGDLIELEHLPIQSDAAEERRGTRDDEILVRLRAPGAPADPGEQVQGSPAAWHFAGLAAVAPAEGASQRDLKIGVFG